MMDGKYLLDTNCAIQLLSDLKRVEERLSRDTSYYLSAIILGELFFGAYKSHRVRENLEKINELMNSMRILSCDEITADHYGLLKKQVRQKGRPIPENDLWLAALARQHSLVLLTRDRHFQDIEGVNVTEW
jgi:tRNA(fMet)-specific endonuclease VapC